MKRENLAMFNPEVERCRRVRAEIDSRYKTLEEAFAILGEIEESEVKTKRAKSRARNGTPKSKKSA